jgi:hypothetical protein
MTRLGMNPGMRKAAPSLDVYTGLLFFAVVCLAAACVMMFLAGSKIGKGGSAFGLQSPPESGRTQLEFGSN